MKFLSFKALLLILTLTFVFNGCKNETDEIPEEVKISIIGKWKMNGSAVYGLEFTNYGIVIWQHKPYMDTNYSYTYSETTLTVHGKNGKGVFSKDGNTLTISGFSDPSSFGTEGSTEPFINGTYIRQ